MRQLLLATRNPHKTREFAEILGDEFAVRDLSEAMEMPVIEETGATFQENAILKAVAASQHFADDVVADDSGLEVDGLNGAPGVFSARYAGEGATDVENIAKLLSQLVSSDAASRAARFRCVLARARRGKVLGIFEGAVEGAIVPVPRGAGGFGYDPVFQPLGYEQTFGELSADEKNKISHRAGAIRSLRAALSADNDRH
ncbi:MAG: RdgB/HAM1 family non-canonical purine NTP pyrophosphatase [Verrucomicrobiaceae bacterium]|nr:RdgB/HAM1 family non-canonical purine NTP pyrophosphatase [Verrucomicrobiaceae bacterium]